MKCEVWQAADMRRRNTYIRNLKELQPFVAMDRSFDEQLAESIVQHLERVETASWSELMAMFASRFEGIVNAEIARLIHAGRVKANLTDHALASNSRLCLP